MTSREGSVAGRAAWSAEPTGRAHGVTSLDFDSLWPTRPLAGPLKCERPPPSRRGLSSACRWGRCAMSRRSNIRFQRVAVGTSVARRPPHRSVRELQLIRLLPWMMATETPQRSLPTHARPPRYHRCPPLCADGARRNERSPWCRPFPPDSPPTISRLCSNPSRVLWPTPTPPPRTRGSYGLGLYPPAC